MYKFRDTTSDWHFHEEWLPTVAMSFNGDFIEHLVPGYRTLTVAGREMLGIELTTENRFRGSHITSERIPARELVITYQMSANTSEELLFRFKQLEKILKTGKDVPIFFNDERNWTYYGRLSSVEEVPVTTNSVVSSFTILCGDPRRFGPTKQISSGLFKGTGDYTILNMEFDIDFNRGFVISNGSQSIRGINVSDENKHHVRIDFTTFNVYLEGEEHARVLLIDSDFENFKLEDDMVISTTNVRNLVSNYAEVS